MFVRALAVSKKSRKGKTGKRRRGGGCPGCSWCINGKLHKNKKRELSAAEKLREAVKYA